MTPCASVENSVALDSSVPNVHWLEAESHVYHWFRLSLWILNFAPWMVLLPSAALIFFRFTS